MRPYNCANHSSFSVRPFFKRHSEDDVHSIGSFEAYFIFAYGKGEWFPVNYFNVDFP